MLDPRITFFNLLLNVTRRQFRPGVTIAAVRAGWVATNQRFGMPPIDGVETAELLIPTRDGATIGAHLHRPAGASGALPLLLFFHGGGCVMGDVPMYDNLTRFFAREGRLAVISVEYRLGPEHRFPIAFEDAFDALAFAQREATALGIDPARIAVGGDSSGGTLAATLSAFSVVNGLERPAFQYLIYPPLDATERFPSRRQFTTGVPLTPALRDFFGENFFRSDDDKKHPFSTQIDAPDPQCLPPTYFQAAGYDSLVDEGRYYADRLRDAGVPIVYDLRPTLAHGFVNLARLVPEARRALRDGIRAVSAALR